MTNRLDPAAHAWLSDAATIAVMDALDAARPDAARFVGGCVRNALMGRPVDDIDIATQLEPEAVVQAAEAAGLKAIPTGMAHGTVTVVADGKPFEVTTLRQDVETDGRNATIAYTDDWAQDSERRDFRLNAMYADRTGAVFDPQNGAADAAAGRIVFIGDPETRIREDYLRILRFFRFTAWYACEINPEGLAACERLASGMRRLSAERVWKELKKLLTAPDPRASLSAMMGASVLEQTLPQALALDLFDALVALERQEAWAPDPMLRLAALIPRMGRVAEGVRTRLKLSNAEGDRLMQWATRTYNPRLLLDKDPAETAKVLYGLHVPALTDRARLAWAMDAAKGEADPQAWRALVSTLVEWERPQFPLTGKDLSALGVKSGPKMGVLLKALEELWVNGGFKASREQLLAALDVVGRD